MAKSPSRNQMHHQRRSLLARLECLEPRLTMSATPISDTLWDYNVLVRFRPNATPANISSAIQSVGGTLDKLYKTPNLMQLQLPNSSQSPGGLNNAINTLQNNPYVRYAETNQRLHKDATPNDTDFGQLYGMNNSGQGGGTADADIDAAEAWDRTTGSSSVIAAVIDTGLDVNHVDIQANVWINTLETAGNNIDDDGNGYVDDINGIDTVNNDSDPMDDDGHGTHVAGTVGAVGNNGIGVVGVNWNVRLLPVKFLGPLGGSTAGAIEAIDYVTAIKQRGENIVVSNNSWGGGGFSQALIDSITQHGNAGILFVAASGNGGADGVGDDLDLNPSYPAAYPNSNIISVAANDRDDALASFSNFGLQSVDISAPGVAIYSTAPTSLVPAGYQLLDGTSMASPHVAGAVALLASAGPFLTSTELQTLILQGADPIPAFNGRMATGARLNVNKSIDLIAKSRVQGTIYTDKAGDGVIQAGIDTVLPNIIVYYDANDNAVPEANETQTLSDANGFYDLGPLPDRPGGIAIRIAPPPDYVITRPPAGFYNVDFVFNGETRTGLDFGVFGPPGEVHGRKWHDVSGNGVIDAGDRGLEDVYIYVDINNDGRASISEPAAMTDVNGNFIIRNVPVGTYALREVLQPGWAASFPATNNGAQIFTMTPRAIITGLDFYNATANDYGDAPDSYKTLTASGGPVHGYRRGFQLGTSVDADADGRPTVSGRGDDQTAFDDEDGVRFRGALSPGNQFTFDVTVSVPNFVQNGYLHGWIDLNGDGDFIDAGEKVVRGERLGNGVYTYTVNAPAGIPLGATYARFRYGVESNIGIGGRSLAGEVEDYRISVFSNLPVARDDGDNPANGNQTNIPDIVVQQFSNNNRLNVLANDVRSTAGRIFIKPDGFTGAGFTTAIGGTVRLNRNGTPTNPFDDFLVYDAGDAPTGHRGRVYNDSFTYTISDGTNEDTATVYIGIAKVSTAPSAVDDIAEARPNPTPRPTTIPVLLNDNPGTDRGTPLTKVALVSFDPIVKNSAGATIGNVTRNDNGTPTDQTDDRLVFLAVPGVNNTTGQFQYTINNPGTPVDPALNRRGTVTVQVRPVNNQPDANDQVKLSIQAFTVAGDGSPGTLAPANLVQGREYWVGVFADDLRTTVEPGGNGAISVYLDMLFDDRFVAPIRVPVTAANPLGLEIRYGSAYDNGNTGASGAVQPGGLIDELGIVTIENVGPSNQAVLFVKFRASAVTPGTVTVPMWKSDPAEERSEVDPMFDHDVLVNDGNDVTAVSIENVAYLRSINHRVVAASPAPATFSTSPTTASAPLNSTSLSSTSLSSSKTSGPSDQELLAYFGSLGSASSSSISAKTSSASPQATDDAITALFASSLLASGR